MERVWQPPITYSLFFWPGLRLGGLTYARTMLFSSIVLHAFTRVMFVHQTETTLNEKSRGRPGGGAGLGLAITRQLVIAHGGHIEAASRVDEGTTSTGLLPLSRLA